MVGRPIMRSEEEVGATVLKVLTPPPARPTYQQIALLTD
jgi:hypothetical protein